jgi:hypothetical protein
MPGADAEGGASPSPTNGGLSARLADGPRGSFPLNSLWRAFPDRFDSDAELFS